jgi:DNA-binding transcriptional ArsR family regulator
MSNHTETDAVFKALANAKRREILDLLQDGPKTTGDICDGLKNVDRCAAMQHIGVLEKAGLIVVKREGRLRWNYLNAVPIQKIYDRWIKSYQGNASRFLTTLESDA